MTARRAAPKTGRVAADVDPVARLMVDVPLAHLDRPFDYLVPDTFDDAVRPGSRVRVRFAGRLVDAFVLERVAESEHPGRLAFLERCVGEPVLTADTTAVFRAVADRWAGNFVDVVRLGVPARHAGAEAKPSTGEPPPQPPESTGFEQYRAGTAFLSAVAAARPARAVWSALPGEDWPRRLAEAARVALAAGRGAVVLVPDARDLNRLDAAFSSVLGPGRHVALSAELGPSERYRRWLAARRGAVRAVIGTRAAAYAPVADLGLLAMWDDGDDLYDEPRAPYAHARDVLVLRSSLCGAALLLGAHARTAEAQQLVESGWAHEISADRTRVRAAAPRAAATGDDMELARDPAAAAARLPSLAWRTARDSLAAGHPVLVQVPRRGYVPALACARDRTPARCPACAGPLGAPGPDAVATCRWCARPAGDWTCPTCGGRRMRAVVVGSARTAEELGRAFPGVTVRTSGGSQVLDAVPAGPALVIATPGAEPVAPEGYGAALLLDGWALLSRPDLRAAEETVRRWVNAAALVRSDGRVVIGADAAIPAVQALVRWDPAGAAARELGERAELRFPPSARLAAVSGRPDAVRELLELAQLPEGTELLGTIPTRSAAGEESERALLRVPRAAGARLAAALKVGAASRSARKAPDPVKIVLDPRELA
ncbi:MAG TPA: primosomal protein N' [Jatrophihabitantaceae bacterium]|nr:primosomal protein N' [Jatrophihabitantaceae bacterium]